MKDSRHITGEKNPTAWSRLLDTLAPSRAAARRLARQSERLESFLQTVPVEYCGWDRAGAQALSPGFCALLGVDTVSSFSDIAAALTPGDAAALSGLHERLSRAGEAFTLGVRPPASGRALRLTGRSGSSFSVIWALDVEDFAAATEQSLSAVREAEAREADLRAALSALPFPVWTRGENLDIAWCNRAYARAVDDTAAAVVREQKELPLTGADKNAAGQRVLAQRAVARKEPQSARGHVIAGGERRLLEMTETPLPAEARGRVWAVGAARDATREEELETAYRRLADSQREVLEQLRTAIAMFGADARLEFYNAAYEQVTGLSGAWLDARPRITDIIDRQRELRRLPEQADYKQFKQAWLNRFTSLLEPHEEMQYLPDGTVLRTVAVPRPAGGLMLTLEDVTSRLRLETSYNTLMAVQKETMDNLAEGVAVFGEDGRLRLSNSAFARIWGVPPEEAAAGPHVARLIDRILPLFPTESREEARQAVLSGALEREPRRGRLLLSGGTVLEYSSMPLPDGNVLNAWFDITDTVKVEQALLDRNAALQEAERLKSDFLANVSYQLRTPLNALMGFAEMLNQQYFGKLNERQLEYTGGMIEAGRRLVSLINDILDLSTIEAGHMKLYPAAVDARALVSHVAELTQDWARKQKLEISVDCPPGLSLLADERRVKQVLLNLISNAINYSPAGGRISLSAAAEDGAVVLRVRDSGLGIPESEIARVFTPFERIRDARAQRRGGAGLGLALVKSIVELHGGTVSLESREGAGTCVTLRLPAA